MKKILLIIFLFPTTFFAQGYTSYFTGNTTNITTTTEFGICLMGGATEHDNAMKWLLQKANGGDVVVLRSSGSNGYNDYLYSELGLTINSVETLVITSIAGAINPYVLDKVANAEMIWFAGGDQYNYVSYFKDNALEEVLNNHINVKNAPIGGTSAGMAILGGKYFSAQNGTVTSAQAMGNPYSSNVTLGNDDFLQVPILHDVITDTHFDSPDRKGRISTFIARYSQDYSFNVKGIASNEYVAVCIGNNGKAFVFGDYPNYQEFAYFIQGNCGNSNAIENCQNGQSLTWNYNGEALKVYKVPGTMNGSNYFDINIWEEAIGSGGSWENWSVVNGVFNSSAGIVPNCALGTTDIIQTNIIVTPNPFIDFIQINVDGITSITIFNSQGKKIFNDSVFQSQLIDTSQFPSGLYFLKIINDGKSIVKKIIKE